LSGIGSVHCNILTNGTEANNKLFYLQANKQIEQTGIDYTGTHTRRKKE
jgi:hypothetical protein